MEGQKQRQPLAGQSGQAVVEGAIIIPAMLFLILLSLQLTMMQQARIATEYAAFAAARAGVVMNGNNGTSDGKSKSDGPMRDAAVWAVLPTFGRADSIPALLATKVRFEAQDLVFKPFGVSQVRVAVLNPTTRDFATQAHLNNKEIDFDDIRPAVAPTTLLSVQVRYLYELRVPFANKMIQSIWLASKVGLLQAWRGHDLTGPRLGTNSGPDAVQVSRAAALGLGSIPDGTPEGMNVTAISLLGQLQPAKYVMPMNAWYTMRMQSNPFLQWAAP